MAAWIGTSAIPNPYTNGTGTATHTVVFPASTATTTAASTYSTYTSTSNGSSNQALISAYTQLANRVVQQDAELRALVGKVRGDVVVEDGVSANITLPDGTVVEVAPDSSYVINNKDAKVIYRGIKNRDFNPFINVSDKVEAFIKYCAEQGVRQGEMLQLPLELFVKWLVLEAARADREPEPDVPLIPHFKKLKAPHCNACGRFLRLKYKSQGLNHCNSNCYDKSMRKVA